jgi:hypothetical protein
VAESGPALVQLVADPVNNIVAGAPRFTGEAVRSVVSTGKGRMPALPHLTAAEVDNVVNFVTTPASGRGRGAARPYPDGVPDYTRYTINEYNTVGNRIKPPFTVIVKYDLNQPGIKWRIPYGDDPELAARGITGTSVPGIQNSIIVTESGLVFGAGRDNFIRAWDSDAGKQLWASRFGGNFTGSLRCTKWAASSICSCLRQARPPGAAGRPLVRPRRRRSVLKAPRQPRGDGWLTPCLPS